MYLTTLNQWLTVLCFAIAMGLCRGRYASMPGFLKPCWAIFFLTGMYIDSIWVLPALMLLAIVIDIAVESSTAWFQSCLTRGYFWLPPAYLALWLAGRLSRWMSPGIPDLLVCMLIGTVAAELLTSGGFYFGSGYFERPNLRKFLKRELHFYPGYALTVMVYVSVVVSVYSLAARSR